MAISIEIITDRPKKIHNVLAYMGKIKIGDYSESIYIPVDFWSIEDYKKQWTEGLQRLKTHDKSCLVVTIHDSNIRPFIDMWVMYKIDDMVYVQNKRYMSEIYGELVGGKPFHSDTCYDFIKQRKTMTEDGYKISEWSVPWVDFIESSDLNAWSA